MNNQSSDDYYDYCTDKVSMHVYRYLSYVYQNVYKIEALQIMRAPVPFPPMVWWVPEAVSVGIQAFRVRFQYSDNVNFPWEDEQ